MSKFPYPSAEQFAAMSADDFASFWEAFESLGMAKVEPFKSEWLFGFRTRDTRDIITLKKAGWTPVFNSPRCRPADWGWRRQPIGYRKLGKFFLSTGQAMTELRAVEAKRADLEVSMFTIELKIGNVTHRGILPAKGLLSAQRMADCINATVIGAGLPLSSSKTQS